MGEAAVGGDWPETEKAMRLTSLQPLPLASDLLLLLPLLLVNVLVIRGSKEADVVPT